MTFLANCVVVGDLPRASAGCARSSTGCCSCRSLLELYVFVARARADRRDALRPLPRRRPDLGGRDRRSSSSSRRSCTRSRSCPPWAQRLDRAEPVRAGDAGRAHRPARLGRHDRRRRPASTASVLPIRSPSAIARGRAARSTGARRRASRSAHDDARDRGRRRLEDVLDPARAAGAAQGVLRASAASGSRTSATTPSATSRFSVARGRVLRHRRRRTAAARAPCSRCSPASTAPTRERSRIGGRLSPFIELGVGFNPEFSARHEHRDQRDADRADAAPGRGAVRRDPRVRRARAVRRPAAQELLVGDAAAARVLGRDPGAVRHPARSTRRSRSATPSSSRSASRRSRRCAPTGKTVVFVSHDLGAVTTLLRPRAAAPATGASSAIGEPDEVIDAYRPELRRRCDVQPRSRRSSSRSARTTLLEELPGAGSSGRSRASTGETELIVVVNDVPSALAAALERAGGRRRSGRRSSASPAASTAGLAVARAASGSRS